MSLFLSLLAKTYLSLSEQQIYIAQNQNELHGFQVPTTRPVITVYTGTLSADQRTLKDLTACNGQFELLCVQAWALCGHAMYMSFRSCFLTTMRSQICSCISPGTYKPITACRTANYVSVPRALPRRAGCLRSGCGFVASSCT